MHKFKTWKREVALGCAVWLGGLASYTAYVGTDEVRLSVLGLFVLPVFGLLGGLFGLDAIQKQEIKKIEMGVPPEGGSAEDDRIIRNDDLNNADVK
jgi:hypothetical protein